MMRRSILQYGGAIAIVTALAVLAVFLHRPSPVVQSRVPHATDIQTIRPSAPPASSPLLTREAWLMHWQPQWLQNAWRREGHPAILWSSSDGEYYLPTRSSGNILLTFPWQSEFAPTYSFPSWFNHPLQP